MAKSNAAKIATAAKAPVDNDSEAPAPTGPATIVVVAKDLLWEPFQGFYLQQGVPTPVKKTSWIDSQIAAKLLKVVEE